MKSEILIYCKNCETAYSLPPRIRAKRAAYQLKTPKDIWTATFLCLDCGAHFQYKEEEIRPRPIQSRKPDQGQRRSTTRILCISFQCGAQGCGLPIAVHALTDSDLTINKMLQAAFRRKFAKTCEEGHAKTKLNAQSELTRVLGVLLLQR